MQGKANSTTGFELSPSLPPQHVNLEVDPGRQREYGRWLLVGLALLGAMIFNAWQRGQTVDLGYELEALQGQRAQDEATGQQLRLEILTFSSPETIDQLALGRLHMVAPSRDDSTIIERIVPPAQPPSSVVALR